MRERERESEERAQGPSLRDAAEEQQHGKGEEGEKGERPCMCIRVCGECVNCVLRVAGCATAADGGV